MTAQAYLSQYRTLNDSINAKLEQVAELRWKAQTVGGSSDGTHSSAPYDRIGEITARIVDLEREINDEIDRSIDVQRAIRAAIADVSDGHMRTVLELRYLNCMKFEDIALKMDYSCRQVRRLHGKALTTIRCP